LNAALVNQTDAKRNEFTHIRDRSDLTIAEVNQTDLKRNEFTGNARARDGWTCTKKSVSGVTKRLVLLQAGLFGEAKF